MKHQYRIGDAVRVRTFGGRTADLVVVGYSDEALAVCKPIEFERAQLEHRKPFAVGFRYKDVMPLGKS